MISNKFIAINFYLIDSQESKSLKSVLSNANPFKSSQVFSFQNSYLPTILYVGSIGQFQFARVRKLSKIVSTSQKLHGKHSRIVSKSMNFLDNNCKQTLRVHHRAILNFNSTCRPNAYNIIENYN